MGCIQTLKGIATDCSNSIGGIKKVWFANSADIAAPTAASGGGDQYTLASEDMPKFKQYDVDRYSSSLTSTFTAGDTGGNRYWTHELTLQFRNLTAESNTEIQSLSQATLAMVILDNNGRYWYLPEIEMNGGTAQTGQGLDDLNGYAPTFSMSTTELPLSLVSFTPSAE